MTRIRTPQHALNTLRKARELDAKAQHAEMKGQRARLVGGTYSGHFGRAERWSQEATERFAAVEEYLASLTQEESRT